MRWSERQRAMLREMGIRLWMPEPEDAPADDAREAIAPAAPATPAASPSPARPVAGSEAAPARRLPGLAPADWLVLAEPLTPEAARLAAAATAVAAHAGVFVTPRSTAAPRG